MNTGLLIGIASGLVSGLILASAAGGSPAGLFVLFFLSPLPIAITGLGWGWFSALAASLSGAGVLAAAIAPKTGFFHLAAIGLPLTALTYLALLHREHHPASSQVPPAQRPPVLVEWYPIGRVLGAASLIAGALAAASLLSIAENAAALESQIRELISKWATNSSALPQGTKGLSAEDIDSFAKLMTRNFGAATATTWMMLACLNLWLGGHVVRASGLMARPWPDLSTITAPRELSLAFIVAVLLSFLPDYPGFIASSFAGAIMGVYVLVGLAVIHNVTKGNAYRALILVLIYVGLIFLQPFSAFVLAMIALAERFLPFRRNGPFDADLPPPPPT